MDCTGNNILPIFCFLKRSPPHYIRGIQEEKIILNVWHCVSNRLKNYVKKENIDVVFVDDYEQSVTVTPFWEQLSKDAMTVAEIILDSPMEFLRLGKTHAPKKIKEILIEEGWDKVRVKRSLTELHIAFS